MNTPVLLDISRSILRRLRDRPPSGIDRVCDAYVQHFAGTALAVVQVRGRAFILDQHNSDELMAAIATDERLPRPFWLRKLAQAIAAPAPGQDTREAFYINVSHSDYDLDAHWRWAGRHQLRQIYLVHDLIPVTHPQVTTRLRSKRHLTRVTRALTGSAGIIANSQSTASELNEFAVQRRLAMPPLLTAPLAGANLPISASRTRSAPPTFLTVGTIETRKNHHLLFKVWSRLIERFGENTPRLVMAGTPGLRAKPILEGMRADPRLAQYVSFHARPDDIELVQLMSHADGVLLPSFAEGFGLTLVEALASGIPVIASDLASFRELGQGIPDLLDVSNVDAWVDVVSDFAQAGLRYQRQMAAIRTYQPTRWDRHFDLVENWLEGLAMEADMQTEAYAARAVVA